MGRVERHRLLGGQGGCGQANPVLQQLPLFWETVQTVQRASYRSHYREHACRWCALFLFLLTPTAIMWASFGTMLKVRLWVLP